MNTPSTLHAHDPQELLKLLAALMRAVQRRT